MAGNFHLGFGLGGRLLLARRGRVCVLFIIIIIKRKSEHGGINVAYYAAWTYIQKQTKGDLDVKVGWSVRDVARWVISGRHSQGTAVHAAATPRRALSAAGRTEPAWPQTKKRGEREKRPPQTANRSRSRAGHRARDPSSLHLSACVRALGDDRDETRRSATPRARATQETAVRLYSIYM